MALFKFKSKLSEEEKMKRDIERINRQNDEFFNKIDPNYDLNKYDFAKKVEEANNKEEIDINDEFRRLVDNKEDDKRSF